jgi:effector-binding domain-containing protein
MIDTPHITETAPQLTAFIHVTVPRGEIAQAMDPAIQELFSAITAQGVHPVGPLLSHHLKMDPEVFDFDLSVPVSKPVAPAGRVQPGELPAARVARTLYQGGYDGLGAAWGELHEWIAANGLSPASDLWESYISGPESSPDPANWRTELNRPLIA